MTLFIIITYKLEFSNQIIEYFKSQNVCNGFKFAFIPLGLDMGTKEEILNSLYEKIDSYKAVENITIFADAGLPNKLAKRIKPKNEKIKVFKSKGSLIENGFLTYIMLNTRAPEETINLVMDDKIEK